MSYELVKLKEMAVDYSEVPFASLFHYCKL